LSAYKKGRESLNFFFQKMSLVNRFFNQPTSRISQPLSVFSQDPFFRQVFDQDVFPTTTPAMDVVETDKQYSLKLNAPGYTKEQISVDVDGNTLIVRGSASEEKEEEGETWIRRERSQNSFTRSVLLGPEIDPSKIKASLKDGILNVQVPKDVTKAQKKITIE
jgi:HSP20 family protein